MRSFIIIVFKRNIEHYEPAQRYLFLYIEIFVVENMRFRRKSEQICSEWWIISLWILQISMFYHIDSWLKEIYILFILHYFGFVAQIEINTCRCYLKKALIEKNHWVHNKFSKAHFNAKTYFFGCHLNIQIKFRLSSTLVISVCVYWICQIQKMENSMFNRSHFEMSKKGYMS